MVYSAVLSGQSLRYLFPTQTINFLSHWKLIFLIHSLQRLGCYDSVFWNEIWTPFFWYYFSFKKWQMRHKKKVLLVWSNKPMTWSTHYKASFPPGHVFAGTFKPKGRVTCQSGKTIFLYCWHWKFRWSSLTEWIVWKMIYREQHKYSNQMMKYFPYLFLALKIECKKNPPFHL